MQHIAAQALSIKTQRLRCDWQGHRGGGWAVDPDMIMIFFWHFFEVKPTKLQAKQIFTIY